MIVDEKNNISASIKVQVVPVEVMLIMVVVGEIGGGSLLSLSSEGSCCVSWNGSSSIICEGLE